jgi:hypothetical protein
MASSRLDSRLKCEKKAKKSKLDNFGSKSHTLTEEDRVKGRAKAATNKAIQAEERRNFIILAKSYNVPAEIFDAIDHKQWKKAELLLKVAEKVGFDNDSSEDAANRKQKVELSGKVDSKLEIEITGVEVG